MTRSTMMLLALLGLCAACGDDGNNPDVDNNSNFDDSSCPIRSISDVEDGSLEGRVLTFGQETTYEVSLYVLVTADDGQVVGDLSLNIEAEASKFKPGTYPIVLNEEDRPGFEGLCEASVFSCNIDITVDNGEFEAGLAYPVAGGISGALVITSVEVDEDQRNVQIRGSLQDVVFDSSLVKNLNDNRARYGSCKTTTLEFYEL